MTSGAAFLLLIPGALFHGLLLEQSERSHWVTLVRTGLALDEHYGLLVFHVYCIIRIRHGCLAFTLPEPCTVNPRERSN